MKRAPGSESYHEITRVDDNCIECDGGSELGGVAQSCGPDLATWGSHSAVLSAHGQQEGHGEGQLQGGMPMAGLELHPDTFGFCSQHLLTGILGLQCATLETKHSSSIFKDAVLTVVICHAVLGVITLSLSSYGLHYRGM